LGIDNQGAQKKKARKAKKGEKRPGAGGHKKKKKGRVKGVGGTPLEPKPKGQEREKKATRTNGGGTLVGGSKEIKRRGT